MAVESLGSMAIGKYHLFASLGRGGMADVYLAVARGPMGFNKLTVIKRLRAEIAADPAFAGMLLDEARLAARLSHPNVVHTYEVGEAGGVYFIAMEYLEGQPLVRIARTAIKVNEHLEPALCARIVADALSGLHYAHELRDYDGTPLQIIHRDVSPHNIFVTYDGVVKLMDFGIAKAASSSTQTEVGVLKGKIAFMAPEQATAGPVDRRSDVFAMGIVLWELLTGERLFQAGSAPSTLHKLLTQPIPRVSSVRLDIDPALDAIAAKALERDPAARFQTAQEMRNALEEVIAKSGAQLRQEDIGRRVTELFEETRQNVQRSIQLHMAEVSIANTTGELMALNRDALRKTDTQVTPSGRNLLQLASLSPEVGSGSGSGSASSSGVLPTAGPESVPGGAPQGKKRRGAFWMVAAAALLLLVGGFVVLRPGREEPTPGNAAPPIAAVPSPPTPATPAAPASVAAPAPTPPPTALAIPTASAPVAAVTPAPAPASHHEHVYTRPTGPLAPPKPQTQTPPPPPPAATPADVGTGYLTLDTYPWTRVTENGRVLGVTPLVHVPLSAGTHVLTLENAEQGLKQQYPVTLKADESVSKRLGLK